MVPVGEGKGEVKLVSGSGILIRRGGSVARTLLEATFRGGSASSTSDWNIRRMFVLGKRNVHLAKEDRPINFS